MQGKTQGKNRWETTREKQKGKYKANMQRVINKEK